jgi:regulator of protease activity HflC (stomatin/prohibitin superfamily)
MLFAHAAARSVRTLFRTHRINSEWLRRGCSLRRDRSQSVESAAQRECRTCPRVRTFPQTKQETTMYKILQVKFNERVVLFRDHLPLRAYGPGRHWLWGRNYNEQRWNTDELTFQVRFGVRELLPSDWYAQLEISETQRGVLYKDGRPVVYLRPGVHRYWRVDESVRLRLFDITERVPAFTDELEALIPKTELLDAKVEAHQAGLLYVQQAFVQQLAPGRYRYWRTPENRPEVVLLDLRRRLVTVSGQELMTKDKVTLRLSIAVEVGIADARRVAEVLSDLESTVYLAAQLAARDYVASVTLDGLLEGRDAFNQMLERSVAPKLARVGLVVESIGVKDIVLPGEMKALLNRVIEAEKEAAANVVLRREEVAATRSLANTAKVMAEQPILLRLKELDAMKEIASRIQEVRVVVGADGLKSLLPANLLDDKR